MRAENVSKFVDLWEDTRSEIQHSDHDLCVFLGLVKSIAFGAVLWMRVRVRNEYNTLASTVANLDTTEENAITPSAQQFYRVSTMQNFLTKKLLFCCSNSTN